MSLQQWGYASGSQTVGLHFPPLGQGIVQVSLGQVYEYEDETTAAIYIPIRYVREGGIDVPRANEHVPMAWDHNLSGVDIVLEEEYAAVRGTWLVFSA